MREKITPNSLLLRDEFDREDQLRARSPNPIDPETISDIITELMEKAGVRTRVKLTEGVKPGRIRHKVKGVHGLRKFWDTQMTLSGVSPLWTELLEGHKIKGMKHHYLRPSDEELLQGSNDSSFLGYIAAIDRLTINDEDQLKIQVKKLQTDKEDLIDLLKGKVAALERANETRQILNDAEFSRP
jgi:hypothetical protein